VREILELLERDARLTAEQIAGMTGLPVQQVTSRIAEWENSGVIRRYKAVVDWDKVAEETGEDVVAAFIDVSVQPARGTGFDDVAARISRFSEVRAVYLVSGTDDVRCTVVGRNIRKVAEFVAQKLSTIERVQGTVTHFVLKTYKRDGDSFLEPDADHRLPVAP
jgi:DNA-binding Lrp family transcriptional regulator